MQAKDVIERIDELLGAFPDTPTNTTFVVGKLFLLDAKACIKELQQTVDNLDGICSLARKSYEVTANLVDELRKLLRDKEQENAKLRETLQFYANMENWEWITKPTDKDYILDCGSEVQRDYGKIAREALNGKGE